MQKCYHDLDIQFLPNRIVERLNQEGSTLSFQPNIENLPTEVLSQAYNYWSNLTDIVDTVLRNTLN